jgi:hypothetical protein
LAESEKSSKVIEKRKREPSIPDESEHDLGLPMSDMSRILKDLQTHECSMPFLEPVDVEEAPGYLQVVKTPMDLKSIGKMLKGGAFAPGKQDFVSTLTLIWSNCYAYNAPKSQIYQWAKIMETYAAELFAKVAARNVPEKQIVEEEDDEQLKKKIKKVPGRAERTALTTALQQLLQEVSKDPRAAPFLSPVSEDDAPGYHDVIKEPMDLSLMTSRISSYEKDPVKLLRDFNLMCDNCQTYNVETSSLYKSSEEFRGFVKQKFMRMCEVSGLMDVDIDDGVNVIRQEDYKEMKLLPPVKLSSELNPPPTDLSIPMYHRVVADTALYKKNNPFLVDPSSHTLSLTVADADRLLDNLLADPQGSNTYVKTKAYQLAAKTLSAIPFPFKDGFYNILNLGYIEEALAKVGKTYLFNGHIAPCGYTSKLTLRMTEESVKVTRKSKSIEKFRDVEFLSFISYPKGIAAFTVALADGVTVINAPHPRDVWVAVLSMPGLILNHIGNKMRRCRAVLNRLCTNPLVNPFLGKVDPSQPDGKEYYNTISAPMWLHEVHQRLVEGSYNSEFEFIWDVQLIFANAQRYNVSGSQLYQSANNLRREFEDLLCQWVHNVEDRSVSDTAEGPWDHWEYLRYFDSPTNMENVCRATGQTGTEQSMLFCTNCEDQYIPGAIGVQLTAQTKKKWACARCEEAAAMKFKLNEPLIVKGYSKDEFGMHLFVRAPDVGIGWMKSTGASKVCMSPLGLVIENSPIEIDKCKKAEASEYEIRIKARAAEFLKENKAGHRLDGDSRRKLMGAAVTSQIPLGALALPDVSSKSYLFSHLPAKDATSKSIPSFVTGPSLSESGFFGLELASCKKLIEGLKNTASISAYVFNEAANIRQSFITELKKSRDGRRLKKLNEERANECIAKERWFWELKLQSDCGIMDRKGGISVFGPLAPEIYEHFANLFPAEFSSEEGETLLSVWDFLASARPFLPETGISFQEIVSSVSQSINPSLPTVSQVIFDEVGCALTTLLLEDMKRRVSHIDAATWHEILWSKPVNVLSWPALATQTVIILALGTYFKHDTSSAVMYLQHPMEGTNLLRMQLFALLVSHPFFQFIVGLEKACENSSFSPEAIQTRCIDSLTGARSAYSSIKEFIDDAFVLFNNVYQQFTTDSVECSATRVLDKWFTSLIAKMGVEYQPFDMKKSPRYSTETSHPSTWTDPQRLSIKDINVQMGSLVNSFDNFKSRSGFGHFYGCARVDKPLSTVNVEDLTSAQFNELQSHPGCFGTLAALCKDKMLYSSTLQRLETAILVLPTSNPDFWTKAEKLDILSCLTEFAAATSIYKELTTNPKAVSGMGLRNALQAKTNNSVSAPGFSRATRVASRDLSDVPAHPKQLLEIIEEFQVSKVADPSTIKCFFSGTELIHAKNEAWVYVPRYMLSSPTGERLWEEDNDRPVALKALVLRLAAAREVAEEEQRSEVVNISVSAIMS